MLYFSRWIVALHYTNNDVSSEDIISLRIVYTMKIVLFSGSHENIASFHESMLRLQEAQLLV